MDAVLCFGFYFSFSLPNNSFTVLQTALNACNERQRLFHSHLTDISIYQKCDCLVTTIVHEECSFGQLFRSQQTL